MNVAGVDVLQVRKSLVQLLSNMRKIAKRERADNKQADEML